MGDCGPPDADCHRLPDDRLVPLARGGHPPAVRALLARHHPELAGLVCRLARRDWLGPADVSDAQQNAVFALLEAARRYRPDGRPGGFRPFVRRVTVLRFRDFRRGLRRAGRRAGQGDGPDWQGRLVGREPDPAEAVARRDEAGRVAAAVAGLVADDRRLCGLLAAGVRLRAAAAELGLSYDAARRRLRRVRASMAGPPA